MKKDYYDDNRVISDMSGVEKRGIMSSWLGALDSDVRRDHWPLGSVRGHDRESLSRVDGNVRDFDARNYDARNYDARNYDARDYDARDYEARDYDARNIMGDSNSLTSEERRALIKYTLKYSLGIGMIFLVAFGLLIWFLLRIWT